MGGSLEQFQKVYRMLEDEESRNIYLNKLNWLISNNQNYIDTIVTNYIPKAPLFTGKSVQELLDSLPQDRGFVLYGAGIVGKTILPHFQNDRRFVGFCSKTKEKQDNGYCGYPVMSPEELISRKNLSVIISTTRADEEIHQILLNGEYPEELIHHVMEYYRYEDPGQYFAPDFMTYGDNEVLVDVGCCELNSSLEMLRHCQKVKKIYAFEPDPDNYKICLERKIRHHLEQIELLPLGAWSERTSLWFDAVGNGVSHVCEAGGCCISVIPIDDVADPTEQITMIKMDIEGAELEALKGAKETIQRDKPKLAVCIYHRPEDMVEIPLYIKQLVPDYKLYIRHHSNTAGETVLYAVMPENFSHRK